MGNHVKNEKVETKTLSIVTNGDKKIFYNTCWLQFHEAALDKHFENLKNLVLIVLFCLVRILCLHSNIYNSFINAK